MVEWNEGQLALLNAIAQVVEKFEAQPARDIAENLSTSNGQTYLKELQKLRATSAQVDLLQKENTHIRAELQATLRDIQVAKQGKSAMLEPSNACEQHEATPNIYGDAETSSYSVLAAKHQVVRTNLHDLMIARQHLEDDLRKSKKLVRQWMAHVDGLNKKNIKLEALLESHGIPVDDSLRAEKIIPSTPAIVASSLIPPTSIESNMRPHRSTSHLSITGRSYELEGATFVGTPIVQVKQAPESEKDRHGVISSSRLESTHVRLHQEVSVHGRFAEPETRSMEIEGARLNRSPLMGVLSAQKEHGNVQSSQFSHSNSTQSDHEFSNLALGNFVQEPVNQDKNEPEDNPKIISCRLVRKNRGQPKIALQPADTKVKTEILSSSPIGLTGIHNLNPNESVDLDDIGRKVETPKKKRQKQISQSNSSRSLKRLTGRPSALQPAQRNKKILPRTSEIESGKKRRRLNEHGAGIFSEDGNNYGDHDTLVKFMKPELDGTRLGHKARCITSPLFDLLEEPSPLRPVLMPGTNIFERSRRASKAVSVKSAKTSLGEAGHLKNSALQRQVLTQKIPNVTDLEEAPRSSAIEPITSEYFYSSPEKAELTSVRASESPPKQIMIYTDKMFTARPRRIPPELKPTYQAARRVKNSPELVQSRPQPRNFGEAADDPDHEPLRARPIRRLGLEHFRVNRNANQGFDFAFSDVVRGREQRKCLPGCTKPECCGEVFRKLAELTTWEQGTPDSSQEERNDVLLNDFLGDNATKLKNMTDGKRDELLIQAKTREMANKHGKHRHAYERIRSPPGFWRTDFPTTQELNNDRNEAFERERELVKKRYEEAMRPGGAWKFRDE